jgi:transposase
MRASSSLSNDQREAAVAWFEKGIADTATATLLGVPRGPVKRLFRRWRIRGEGALVTKPTRQSYSFDFKLALVERFIAGESSAFLAAEADLSSPRLLETWVRVYRREGADALRSKPKGRPPKPDCPPPELSELERLRQENERLRAEVAYLGKLRALRAQQ